ncbi:hypothetical protein C0Q70_15598 [Pomacea canaliculata]|uniref:Rhodanese domain-containing protein n=1 Tax=Pomacea canaliculata TaxID=400727 RepID=A0A2T7NVA5_POMCA|nr:hypothetical protein C0Q70_15598 [Pomacea canaliculata]
MCHPVPHSAVLAKLLLAVVLQHGDLEHPVYFDMFFVVNLLSPGDYKFRKDEIFKRMKVTTFVQLVIQVADYDSQADMRNGSGEDTDRPDTADLEVRKIQDGNEAEDMAYGDISQRDTDRSRLEQVIRGVGEVDLNSEKHDVIQPMISPSSCPYLLLDIRDQDAYNECHIITAKSYPIAMLSRSVNYETKDMLQFKNQPGKIIVIYDEDEKISHRAATTLVQRGYDNLFMLSGGLKVACRLFPEGLITGTVPTSLLDSIPNNKPKMQSQSPVPRVPADKTDFTQEDLDKLSIYTDMALCDNSSASRLSQKVPRGARTSSASTVLSSIKLQHVRPSCFQTLKSYVHQSLDMAKISE